MHHRTIQINVKLRCQKVNLSCHIPLNSIQWSEKQNLWLAYEGCGISFTYWSHTASENGTQNRNWGRDMLSGYKTFCVRAGFMHDTLSEFHGSESFSLYGTWRFIILFTKARSWSSSFVRQYIISEYNFNVFRLCLRSLHDRHLCIQLADVILKAVAI